MSTVVLLAVGLSSAASSWAQQPAAPAGPAHKVVAAADVVWSPGPPSAPPGIEMAVVSGDPTAAAPFTLRFRMPAGYRVPPHWHPVDEHVTVLSGTLSMGMGERFEEKAATAVAAGGFVFMPAQMRHYAFTREGCVFQLHGVGPFVINYVNPADDPRQAAAK